MDLIQITQSSPSHSFPKIRPQTEICFIKTENKMRLIPSATLIAQYSSKLELHRQGNMLIIDELFLLQ